jgi:hypothetical protein
MAPTQQQITVALEALEADAEMWREAAAVLHDAATSAADLRVDSPAFSFAGQEVAAAYEGLSTKLTGLVKAGADNLDLIAATLRACAAAYRAEEEAGVHRMRNVY